MGEDWINVRLTQFGERYLKETGGGALTVHEGTGFAFESGRTVRVTRAFDWERVLKQQHLNGHALFEIASEEEAKPKKAQPRAAVPTANGEEK